MKGWDGEDGNVDSLRSIVQRGDVGDRVPSRTTLALRRMVMCCLVGAMMVVQSLKNESITLRMDCT